ncbi:hypothetical protein FOHLNKBM_1801 [Methylobacterium longum]|nr:hypothetical protein FOHLNKBM_1801 [Methylobacterium longum]
MSVDGRARSDRLLRGASPTGMRYDDRDMPDRAATQGANLNE